MEAGVSADFGSALRSISPFRMSIRLAVRSYVPPSVLIATAISRELLPGPVAQQNAFDFAGTFSNIGVVPEALTLVTEMALGGRRDSP